ncbi:hypothetical protein OV079_39240 [Nannocystis pusilla]|uniref:Uncharacterized protein n=1 Tax=Nannocystis pusilla TaxID=889268 RepID=A0A9X3EWJ9_9BACT|nr:hypothetical protein [Nannocystis pusilla]MCY1011497.1 hypothetical protein [Nannocystis pusilla]
MDDSIVLLEEPLDDLLGALRQTGALARLLRDGDRLGGRLLWRPPSFGGRLLAGGLASRGLLFGDRFLARFFGFASGSAQASLLRGECCGCGCIVRCAG